MRKKLVKSLVVGDVFQIKSTLYNHNTALKENYIKQVADEYKDLIPEITIDTTFLEPTCGNGNFVIEILKRKFDLCKKKADYIRALKSVYAIDILEDNIAECKQRVKKLYESYGQRENIDFIIDTNIFYGNSLAIMNLLEMCNATVDK